MRWKFMWFIVVLTKKKKKNSIEGKRFLFYLVEPKQNQDPMDWFVVMYSVSVMETCRTYFTINE